MVFAALALGWAGGTSAAEQKWRRTDPFTTIWNTKLHADPGVTPDFVEQSRPAEKQDFLPLAAPQTERPTKRKSAAELKAMETDLEAAGAANRRRALSSAVEAPGKKSGKVSTVRSDSAAPIH
jgi:hypothetical protein